MLLDLFLTCILKLLDLVSSKWVCFLVHKLTLPKASSFYCILTSCNQHVIKSDPAKWCMVHVSACDKQYNYCASSIICFQNRASISFLVICLWLIELFTANKENTNFGYNCRMQLAHYVNHFTLLITRTYYLAYKWTISTADWLVLLQVIRLWICAEVCWA